MMLILECHFGLHRVVSLKDNDVGFQTSCSLKVNTLQKLLFPFRVNDSLLYGRQ